MNISSYQNEFKKILNREYFSSKINPIRKIAFDQLLKYGLPSNRWDDLRFTNFSAFKNNDFKISEIEDAPIKDFDYSSIETDNSYKIVFHNGHYQKHISNLPDEIEVLSNLEYCERKDWEIQQPNKLPFDLLNTAFMDSGMSLVLKKNKKIDLSLFVIFFTSGEKSLMISPRLHIDLGTNSSLSLFEHHFGVNNSHFSNISTFISLEDGSNFNHTRIQMDSNESINIGNIHTSQGRDSKYKFSNFSIGSDLGSININTSLNGKGSECHLSGLSLSKDKQHMDTHILTRHNATDCISTQNFKTILKDNSSGVFNGKVVVQKDAQKTNSEQSNKNLLLSENAKINSNPQLVIHADNVKCAHGSSTGEIDPDALFYMQSRGLDQNTAKSLLINGFASEIFEQINDETIQKYIFQQFNKWINE